MLLVDVKCERNLCYCIKCTRTLVFVKREKSLTIDDVEVYPGKFVRAV